MVQKVKSPLAKAGDTKDTGSIPGSGRSSGEGNDILLQDEDSCLENPMDREAWRATVHGVAQLDTTECVHVHAHTHAHTHTHTTKDPTCHIKDLVQSKKIDIYFENSHY